MGALVSSSGGELWRTIANVAISIFVLAGIVGLVILISWWRGRHKPGPRSLAVDATLTLAAWFVIMNVILLIISTVTTLTSPSVTISDFPVPTDDNGNPINPVPCKPDAPGIGTHLTCYISQPGFATIVGLDTGIRALLASQTACTFLLVAFPAAALGAICFQLLRGIPFTRSAPRMLVATAGVLIVVGVLEPVIGGIARGLAASAIRSAGTGEPGYSITVMIWPFAAALALVALAAVFRYGAKLQRDTELLV